MLKDKNFYIKTLLTAVGILSVCYFFMLTNFWFGYHDWGFLKEGVSISSGFFEVRYSQHLMAVTLLEGQMLPFFSLLLALLFLSLTGILVGSYFGVPQNRYSYLVLALFMGLNPYIYVHLYYVHYMFQVISWTMVSVLVLFCAERPYNFKKIVFGSFLFFLLLGSYPPVLTISFVLFCAKRLLENINKKETLLDSIKQGIYLGIELITGYLCFKFACYCLLLGGVVDIGMYNLAISSPTQIIHKVFIDSFKKIYEFGKVYPFLEKEYCFLLCGGIISAIITVLINAKHKRIFALFALICIFIISQFVFIISEGYESAAIRIDYFPRLSIYLFSLVVLLKAKTQWLKNIVFVWICGVLLLFVKTDSEIQKVQYLGFKADMSFHKKIAELVYLNENFNEDGEYIAMNLGLSTPMRRRFYNPSEQKIEELLDTSLTFYGDAISEVFFEENKNPVVITAGFIGKSGTEWINRLRRGEKNKLLDKDFWSNNPENITHMRWWLYNKAVPGMSFNSLYIDNKYILLVPDNKTFYKRRENFLNNID